MGLSFAELLAKVSQEGIWLYRAFHFNVYQFNLCVQETLWLRYGEMWKNKEKCISQSSLLVPSFLFISRSGHVALDHTSHKAGSGLWPLMAEN